MTKLAPNTRVIAKALAGPPATYSIDKHPGLYLAVMGDGRASWRIRYRPTPGVNQRWFTITTDARNANFDDVARKSADLLTDLRVHGTDPHSVRETAKATEISAARTFEAVYDEWIARPGRKKTLRRRSLEAYIGQMKHIRPHFGAIPISDLTKDRIRAALEMIRLATTDADQGRRGYMATKCYVLTRAVCRYAVDQDYVERDQTRGLSLPVPKSNPAGKQNRAPTDPELKAIWSAAPQHMNAQHVCMLRLALLIGKRVSEICGARRDELDLTSERPWWRIPAGREGNKSSEEEIVPLPPLAVRILREHIESSAKSPYVFPARGLKDTPTLRQTLTGAFRKLRDALDIPEAVRFHDARGLITDHLAKMRVPSEYRSHVLHHTGDTKSSLANSVYSSFDFEPEKRKALEMWGRRLEAIVDGHPLPTECW